ncbi:EcsC protein family protein [Enhydrobacter aerosaccus]|uniref:EcsC protein family protein n=1 Tax=Enhydrobacter aerosaccus TaxID=225324 RepID=A0A1T4LGG8_9HYPH|nr:EcsC family protein [Enhydrobacter aerosaccus]SJZ53839.1 EcsC protein family protein [Enhydrobacter aerosaccus]
MQDPNISPPPADYHDALVAAVQALENPNLAARIADYAGAPLTRVLSLLPRVADAGVTRVVELAMLRSLKTAIRTLDLTGQRRRPATFLSSMAAGVTGGVGGFVGIAALPVELPVTTTLMLRAIADIARHNGEDLSQVEPRLACLQVFALGARSTAERQDVGYLAARALLSRVTSDAAAYLVERGAAELSGRAVHSFLTEIVTRFSVVVSDRIVAGAAPVIGAVGGATVNVIFMNHFQEIAKGHFTVRRLERRYGVEPVRRRYADIAARLQQRRR